MVDESDSQPNSKARWLAISGAFITGSAGIVMAVYSVMSGDETGGGALLAASALTFGLLAAYVDKVPNSSNRNEAAAEAGSANGSAPDPEADALAGSAKLDVEPITERELEVLCHVAEGFSNKLISAELGISERTVKNHLTLIMGKLRASDRTHAVVTAIRMGWLDVHEGQNQPAVNGAASRVGARR